MSHTAIRVLAVVVVLGLGLVAMFDDIFNLEETVESQLASLTHEAKDTPAAESKGAGRAQRF